MNIRSMPYQTMPRFLLSSLLAFMLAGCQEKNREPAAISFSGNLKLLEVHPLAVKEPSGLSISPDGQSLWTVSDESGTAYQMSLTGEIIRSFQTGMKDVEGIDMIDDQTLAIVAERSRTASTFNLRGERLSTSKINLSGTDNDGLEGIAYDPEEKKYYVVKEKSPGLLIVLDQEMKEISRKELTFALDYSSIDFESARGHLWILSDMSGTVHVLDRELNIRNTFSTNVVQAEGIAVDHAKRRMYLVSDKAERLYVFEFDTY